MTSPSPGAESRRPDSLALLSPSRFEPYYERFAGLYAEEVVNAIPDREAWGWTVKNVPLLDCSDAVIEEIYYFRWWIYRKHLKATPDGFVVTEFLPDVRHGGKHNTINCPLGHQFYEGRWIRDRKYLDDYARFMLRHGGNPNAYTCWFADGLYQRHLVAPDDAFLVDLLPELVGYYRKWEERKRDGLFHHTPRMDGMEFSISGNQDERHRPTFNSYMYADALAIARVADLAGDAELAKSFRAEATALKTAVQTRLWHPELEFFVTRDLEGRFMPEENPVREIIGYIPWYFRLPEAGYEAAWRQLKDSAGFNTPIGLTSAEIRHPGFLQMNPTRLPTWDGPVWPFTTSQTLVALQNLLRGYEQPYVTAEDYVRELHKYAASHRRDGKPNISEVLRDPYVAQMGGSEHYNHSTFCDLVITGLAGLVPREDGVLEIDPLFPEEWSHFCLDGIPYRGRSVAVVWDRTGERYGEKGFRILVDGEPRHFGSEVRRVTFALPPTSVH